jgi:hypothetical protein
MRSPAWLSVGLLLAAFSICSCADSEQRQIREGIRPSYDKETGRLKLLSYDSNKDGRIDTWTDMDGARPLRSRIDRDGDGTIDRWEDYDQQGRLVRVGFSRRNTGTPDAWASPRADNTIDRVEISSSGDEHKIDRWEYYDPSKATADGQGALVRAEEDTNGDGKPDKWEGYEAGALVTVAFDEDHDGTPDRRFTYRGGALVLIESQPQPSGQFALRTAVK